MAFCPECGGEYIDSIDVCPKCRVALADADVLDKKENDMQEKYEEGFKEELLANVNSVVELSYITAALDEKNIGYRVLEEKEGSYLSIMHGKSYVGESIYVEESRLDEAREVLESLGEAEESNEDYEYAETSASMRIFKKLFRIVVLGIVGAFALGILFYLVVYIILIVKGS